MRFIFRIPFYFQLYKPLTRFTILNIIMGQNHPNPFREGSPLMSEYSVDSRDTQLSQTFLTHTKTDKQYLLKEFTFNQLRQFSITSQKLQNRKNLNSNHITTIQSTVSNIQLWKKGRKIKCVPIFIKYMLCGIIPIKLWKDNLYNVKERMQDIVSSCIKGLKAMQEKQVKHQCLTTKTILVQKNGIIKVADPLASGSPTNLDSLYNNRALKNIYLSPEQCESIELQKPIFNKNPFKNDVFTMGMLIIECGLLQPQTRCYKEDSCRINSNQIAANINIFGQRYQPNLKQTVEIMTRQQIKNRPDWIELNHLVFNQINSPHKINTARDGKVQKSIILNNKEPTKFLTGLPTIKSVQSQSSNTYYSVPSNNFDKGRPSQSTPIQFTKFQAPAVSNNTIIANNYTPIRSSASPFTQSVQPINRIQSPIKQQISFTIKPNTLQQNVVPLQPLQPINQQPKGIKSTLYGNAPSATVSQITHSNITFNRNQIQDNRIQIQQNRNPPQSYFNATFGQLQTNQVPFRSQTIENKNINSQFGSVPPKSQVNSQVCQVRSQTITVGHTNSIFNQKDQTLSNNIIYTSPITQKVQEEPQFVEQFFKMGSRYQGYKLNGMRHGKGKFYYQDGGSYDGQWKFNKMSGYGTLYYRSNKKAYQGNWKDDQFQGAGTLYNENPAPLDREFDYRNFDQIQDYWVLYTGDFKEDSKHGKGTLKFSNGEEFRGLFNQDMVQGEGQFFTKNQLVIHGIWKQNNLVQLIP